MDRLHQNVAAPVRADRRVVGVEQIVCRRCRSVIQRYVAVRRAQHNRAVTVCCICFNCRHDIALQRIGGRGDGSVSFNALDSGSRVTHNQVITLKNVDAADCSTGTQGGDGRLNGIDAATKHTDAITCPQTKPVGDNINCRVFAIVIQNRTCRRRDAHVSCRTTCTGRADLTAKIDVVIRKQANVAARCRYVARRAHRDAARTGFKVYRAGQTGCDIRSGF